jgi:hypothetical protein
VLVGVKRADRLAERLADPVAGIRADRRVDADRVVARVEADGVIGGGEDDAASNRFRQPMMLDWRMVSQGPSTECPPRWMMPSMPSTAFSTSSSLARSAATNGSCDCRSAGSLMSLSLSSG